MAWRAAAQLGAAARWKPQQGASEGGGSADLVEATARPVAALGAELPPRASQKRARLALPLDAPLNAPRQSVAAPALYYPPASECWPWARAQSAGTALCDVVAHAECFATVLPLSACVPTATQRFVGRNACVQLALWLRAAQPFAVHTAHMRGAELWATALRVPTARGTWRGSSGNGQPAGRARLRGAGQRPPRGSSVERPARTPGRTSRSLRSRGQKISEHSYHGIAKAWLTDNQRRHSGIRPVKLTIRGSRTCHHDSDCGGTLQLPRQRTLTCSFFPQHRLRRRLACARSMGRGRTLPRATWQRRQLGPFAS